MKVGGRTDNTNNPLRARMWHSRQPAAAWFATIFNPIHTSVDADSLQALFPDASYILVGYCLQEVAHVHVVLTLCNVYSREFIQSRLQQAFGGTARRSPTVTQVCPIYGSVPAAVNYVSLQIFDAPPTEVVLGDPSLMGAYGNAWEREYTGDRGAGVTASKLRTWCLQGFPLYAVTAAPHSQTEAMRASVAFNRACGSRRGHYNTRVKVVHASNGDGTEPIADCHEYLLQFFGSGVSAMPFVYDIRGLLGPFTRDPFPGYTGQPGVVLLVSANYEQVASQRVTVAALQERQGAYGNLEVIWVVRL